MKDMLVSSRVVYPPEEEVLTPKLRNTCMTCPTITCQYCKYLDKSDSVHSSFLEKTWKGSIGCRISCLTDNVVYMCGPHKGSAHEQPVLAVPQGAQACG